MLPLVTSTSRFFGVVVCYAWSFFFTVSFLAMGRAGIEDISTLPTGGHRSHIPSHCSPALSQVGAWCADMRHLQTTHEQLATKLLQNFYTSHFPSRYMVPA